MAIGLTHSNYRVQDNLKPDDFLILAVVFVVFCLDVYFFRYGRSSLSNAAIDTFSIDSAPCTLHRIFYTAGDLRATLQCT